MNNFNQYYRCSCKHKPILAETRMGNILIKKQDYFILTELPLYLSCGQCGQWYEIDENMNMIKKDRRSMINKIGHVCINCGYVFTPSKVRENCPKCGQIQTTLQLGIKQNRNA